MSEKRIQCTQCDTMILEVTAKYNDGLCGPCKRSYDYDRKQAQREAYRKNPPKTQEEIDQIAPDTIDHLGLRIFLKSLLPRKLDPSKYTQKRFIEALQEIVFENKNNSNKLAEEFLDLCDPIIHQKRSLFQGIKRLPRPFREAMAVYQLWGMTTSDGASSYLENTGRKFDAEVELGLSLLKKASLIEPLKQARKSFDPMEGLAEHLEDKFEDLFYSELGHEFEETILASFLMNQFALK